jgi:ubiquinone/menaquinone biosynthesis C-methylase UbiE
MKANYDRIGHDYDIARRADPFLTALKARLLRLEAMGAYLDVGCGTGNYTTALAPFGGHWTGVDSSDAMLRQARAKDTTAQFVRGHAESLPIANASHAGVLCSLALHHFDDLDATFGEMARVLCGGGRVVLFTASPEQMKRYWLNAYFPDAMARAIAQMPAPARLQSLLRSVGFEDVIQEPYSVREDLTDGFLFIGKHRPELYLSANVRAGSSTFRTLATADEIASGCAALEHDLSSGRFQSIRQQYANEHGDYLFISASRF